MNEREWLRIQRVTEAEIAAVIAAHGLPVPDTTMEMLRGRIDLGARLAACSGSGIATVTVLEAWMTRGKRTKRVRRRVARKLGCYRVPVSVTLEIGTERDDAMDLLTSVMEWLSLLPPGPVLRGAEEPVLPAPPPMRVAALRMAAKLVKAEWAEGDELPF
jgi:hypothetical protein